VVREALTEYSGVQRRFEIIGEEAGVTVVDDYAHHPTEIRATLAAARQRFPESTLWAVFQPHTYSRTRTLLDAFAQSFSDADHVILTEIFAAREAADPETTGQLVADRIEHPDVHFFSRFSQSVEHLLQHIQPGSVVITLSAGDGNEVGEVLLQELASREGERGDD
jgi:UDP-N-acetylmuramate--alanine ligase